MNDWKDYIIALRQMANDIGITQIGIAERTGIRQAHVSRFFSCENVPRLDTFLRIAEAVGASVEVCGRDETKKSGTPINSRGRRNATMFVIS